MNTDNDEKRRQQEKLENKEKNTPKEGSPHEPLFPCPICKRTHKKSVRCSPR